MILLHSKRDIGLAAEEAAYQYLLKQGLKPVLRNYNCKLGEIDLIMQECADLVFIEVRYRKQIKYGSPLESITYTKQQKLIKTAAHYLQTQRLYNFQSCRFDVVSVLKQVDSYKVEWLKNAFQVS